MTRLLALLVVLFGVGVAHAADCKKYTVQNVAGEFNSASAAASAAAAWYCSINPTTYSGCTVKNLQMHSNYFSFYISGTDPTNGDTRNTQDWGGDWHDAADCTCDTSDPTIGQTFSGTAATMSTGSYCDPVSHCKVNVHQAASVGGENVYTGTKSSASCGGDDPDPGAGHEPDASNKESCAGSGEFQYCAGAGGEANCGYINDSPVCLKKVPSGGCATFGDGSKVCQASASTPPAPDNGTAGNKATPDAIFQARTSASSTITNFQYFSSTTVNGSARDPNVAGPSYQNGDGSSSSGSGDGDGEEDGDGEASGGEGCDVPPSCSGDPIACAQLHQQWLQRCPGENSEQQVEDAVGDPEAPAAEEIDVNQLDDSVLTAGGECPGPSSIQVFGETIELDFWPDICFYAEKFAAVVLLLAGFAALRIVFAGAGGGE